jgi:hypothetical protein
LNGICSCNFTPPAILHLYHKLDFISDLPFGKCFLYRYVQLHSARSCVQRLFHGNSFLRHPSLLISPAKFNINGPQVFMHDHEYSLIVTVAYNLPDDSLSCDLHFCASLPLTANQHTRSPLQHDYEVNRSKAGCADRLLYLHQRRKHIHNLSRCLTARIRPMSFTP